MKFAPIRLLVAGDMSSATLESHGVDLNQVALCSLQAVFLGSPVGTLVVEVSNDDVPAAPAGNASAPTDPSSNVVNWTTYSGSSVSVSAEGNFLWNIPDVGFRWIRVTYTKTSGTGSLDVTYSGKGV